MLFDVVRCRAFVVAEFVRIPICRSPSGHNSHEFRDRRLHGFLPDGSSTGLETESPGWIGLLMYCVPVKMRVTSTTRATAVSGFDSVTTTRAKDVYCSSSS